MLRFKKVTLPLAATVLCYAITAESAFAATVNFKQTRVSGASTIYEYTLDYDILQTPGDGDILTFTTEFPVTKFGLRNAVLTGYKIAVGHWDPRESANATSHTWRRNTSNIDLNTPGAKWQTFFIEVPTATTESSPTGLNWETRNIDPVDSDPSGTEIGPVLTVVPEPFSILGSGVAVAFGIVFKRELGKSKKNSSL